MTPQKYRQNLHTSKKYSFFLKTPQKIENQNFEPQKIVRAYGCVKISESPPPGGRESCRKVKKINLKEKPSIHLPSL